MGLTSGHTSVSGEGLSPSLVLPPTPRAVTVHRDPKEPGVSMEGLVASPEMGHLG